MNPAAVVRAVVRALLNPFVREADCECVVEVERAAKAEAGGAQGGESEEKEDEWRLHLVVLI